MTEPCEHETKPDIYPGMAYCKKCGQQFKQVPNGPDDFEWVEFN